MKEKYRSPEMAIIYIKTTDILTTSGYDELPDLEPEF